ncbi:MAG: YgiT-type zinc finger protein, partial [Mesorhizobium sp.]
MTTDSQTCELCGAKALVKTIQTEQFPYGSGDDAVILTANVPVWSCIKCGESFTGGEAEDLRHEAVCLHLGRLAPKEVWAIRDSYGLTQEQFAELTGFGVASIKRWESAHQIQNLSADRYL